MKKKVKLETGLSQKTTKIRGIVIETQKIDKISNVKFHRVELTDKEKIKESIRIINRIRKLSKKSDMSQSILEDRMITICNLSQGLMITLGEM